MATATYVHTSNEEGRVLSSKSLESNHPKRSADRPCSVPDEAMTILMDHLLHNPSLAIPSKVSEDAPSVVFGPSVEPFMLTPMKMTESVSALWACVGLFGSAVCQDRYKAPKPKRIEVDVHAATLMLMSLSLFEIQGLEKCEAMQRVAYVDKGQISEQYRALATNMYVALILITKADRMMP